MRRSGRDECNIGLSLRRERATVEDGGNRGRRSWYAEGYRTDRAAIHGAVVDGGEEDNRSIGRNEKSERQKDGDAVHGSKTWKSANKKADHDADHEHEEIDRLKRLAETADGQTAHRAYGTREPAQDHRYLDINQ